MKILHTADLHLGHTFYGFNRDLEQHRALEHIEQMIAEHQPDAYIISGDVYHTTAPQISAQEMLMSHLMNAHRLCPQMRIVVTAGNHDSNRIEVDDPLWNLVGVTVIASISRNILEGEDNVEYHQRLFKRHILPVEKEGRTIGYIVAIPHCYPGNFPSVKPELPREEREKAFIALLMDEVERVNVEALPVVMMAHTAVRPAPDKDPDALGQDLEIIGGIDMVNADVFGDGYDYLALGHIHYAQNISERIRYSGSMLPVSFDEAYPHSLSLVEIGAHSSEPEVRTLEVENLMPVVTIPEQKSRDKVDSLTWTEAKREFELFPADQACYLRLNVTDDGSIPPDAKDIAAKIPQDMGLKAKFCLINRVAVEKEDKSSGGRTMLTTSELSKMGEGELARLHYRESENEELPDELAKLLDGVIYDVKNRQQQKTK